MTSPEGHIESAEADAMLVERIADHFPGARVSGNTVSLGFAGLSIECQLNRFIAVGDFRAASMMFRLRGDALVANGVFASFVGYGETDHEALITGACNWACTAGPVLRAALNGEDPAGPTRVDVTVHGRPYRVVLDGIDRAFTFQECADIPTERISAARARFGGTPWLTPIVTSSGNLPPLSEDNATIFSVFVCERVDQRTVEVKINGDDWASGHGIFASVQPEPPGAMILMREIAVLVPAPPRKRNTFASWLRNTFR